MPAIRTPFTSKPPSATRRRPKLRFRPPLSKWPLKRAKGEIQSFFNRVITAVMTRPASFLASAFIVAVVVWFVAAFVERIAFPTCAIVVLQFEPPPGLADRLPISGRGASDLFVDALNSTITQGSKFRGAQYYAYGATGAQSIALERSIKIPIQPSYGIELKGISIDKIIQFRNSLRYHQWTVSGTLVSSGDQMMVIIRLNADDVPRTWKIATPAKSDPADFLQLASDQVLSEVNPELLGRAYLQRGATSSDASQQREDYQHAAEIFRQWVLQSPNKWEPAYYLSLAYDYQGMQEEASLLANWSGEIERGEKDFPAHSNGTHANPPSGEDLAKLTQAVLYMDAAPAAADETEQDANSSLASLKKAEQLLRELSSKDAANANYSIQLARTLHQEAWIEGRPVSGRSKAIAEEHDAITHLDEAVKSFPQNGGLWEQRAILQQQLVSLMEGDPAKATERGTLEEEEINGFKRALLLRPTEVSPLWGAVYGLLERRQPEKAVELAHTTYLLLPDSVSAEVAYIFALESAGQSAQAEEKLPDVLERADAPQLGVLFQSNFSCEGLRWILEAAKRRFPGDPAFPFPGVQHYEVPMQLTACAAAHIKAA